MLVANNRLYWMVGAVALVLIFGFLLPRHVLGLSHGAPAFTESTVPPQVLAGATDPSAVAASPPAKVAVYVCGDVRRPGVYSLPSGLRVADGIAKAGGALADADLEQLNLAQPLNDAMKIDVPKRGQIVAATTFSSLSDAVGQPGARSRHRSGRSSHKLQPGQTLDVNTASESELTALPGVGPGLARRIVEYRTANGPFQTVDDLQNVSGIGPSKFERMAPYVRL